ncbi:MAG: hemolysin family protein [Thermomicrobiales bacterium]
MSGIAVELVVIVVLLGINAFLAASEISIVSSGTARLQTMVDEGSHAARRVLALAEHPGGFLATVQVGITLAGFFASAVGAVSFASVLEDAVTEAPIGFVADNAGGVSLVIVTALLSFVSIVFGELVPKTLAVSRAEAVALRVVRPVEVLARMTHPLVVLLTGTTNAVLRLLGSHQQARLPSVTEAELLAMLETAEDEGAVEADEADLVQEALGFGDIVVRSVMVPRVAVEALDGETTLGEAVERFFATGHSRLPVYRETPDDVLGVLYVKDAFRVVWADREAAAKPVAELIRAAYFVPETKPIDELLDELRTRRTHVALVVDEYGGLAGLVTMEDLLEELVGEIVDEFDPGYEPVHEIAPGVFEVDGRFSLVELYEQLDLPRKEIAEVETESVGGLISTQLGRIPAAGNAVTFGPLRLTVESMVGYRVALARVERVENLGETDVSEGAGRD